MTDLAFKSEQATLGSWGSGSPACVVVKKGF